ncbi:hypothetical protein MAPG_08371 [Magnaporthiopsis poae ATCC 64411]|uniref:Uncharacterized protein n=1 Tax=Magnaporthiopsis poae (strain ATCC 64411 / 73-15) TaxID=644358 RepID=A0A0C4E769_MAGP6|nr:hypothetical protein MAPG_08371 [Magnaporthiopsis poae ATCC 64411]
MKPRSRDHLTLLLRRQVAPNSTTSILILVGLLSLSMVVILAVAICFNPQRRRRRRHRRRQPTWAEDGRPVSQGASSSPSGAAISPVSGDVAASSASSNGASSESTKTAPSPPSTAPPSPPMAEQQQAQPRSPSPVALRVMPPRPNFSRRGTMMPPAINTAAAVKSAAAARALEEVASPTTADIIASFKFPILRRDRPGLDDGEDEGDETTRGRPLVLTPSHDIGVAL